MGILRSSAQLSTDALPSIEQTSIGGWDTVRGYRENRIVRDNGLLFSVELRQPILIESGESVADVAIFGDSGYGWNARGSSQGEMLGSVGAGVLVHPKKYFNFELYYGYPFRHFHDEQTNLQDLGIYFSLVVQSF